MRIKTYSAAVLGYYGFGSLGDEAVLKVITQALSTDIPMEKICIIGARSGEHGGCTSIGRKNIVAVILMLISARMLVVGGGSLFQDATSRRSLWYYTVVVRLARILRCKIFVYANGIGPLKHQISAAKALWCSDRISLRDPDSFRFAMSLGTDPQKAVLRADPVFCCKSSGSDAARRFLISQGLNPDARFAAVSLRMCPGKKQADFQTISAVCAQLCADGIQPLFLPMENRYDGEICRQMSEQCGGVCVEVSDAEMLCAVLSLCCMSIGMRLHFLLCSAVAGTPFVALSYDCKIDSAVKYLGCGMLLDACLPDYDKLLSACREACADKKSKEKLTARSRQLSALAREDSEELSRFAACCVGAATHRNFYGVDTAIVGDKACK